jgi:hypothetical protein
MILTVIYTVKLPAIAGCAPQNNGRGQQITCHTM